MTSPRTFVAILYAAAILVAACEPEAPELAAGEAEVKCPPEGCEPPDPPEPEPDPEPTDPDDLPPKDPVPTQPDPAKYRTTFIPVGYIKFQLLAALAGTKVQVSHTVGETMTVHVNQQECTTSGNVDVTECKAECNADPDFTPAQKAACRKACEQQLGTTTCSTVCNAYDTKSFLRWGPSARQASLESDPKICNAGTCPACSTPTEVPKLEDRALPVPIFDKSYDLVLYTHRIYCVVNQWSFEVLNNVNMEATSEGIFIRISGSTGYPAIHCEGAPDPVVNGLALQVHFKFPAPNISVDATLTGDWSVFGPVVDFLADLNDRISTAIRDRLHDTLNTAPAEDTYRKIFRGLVERYVLQEYGETVQYMGSIYAAPGGINVNYWVK